MNAPLRPRVPRRALHGVLLLTPVHWYQAPSALKLMIDRLVCADGGNPDPTRVTGQRWHLLGSLSRPWR